MEFNQTPPSFFLRFFRWYCHPKLLNRIEGDLMEVYFHHLAKSGKRKADIRFIVDVVLLLRPAIIRPVEGHQNLTTYSMYKSYFRIGWRNLRKNKAYSFINVTGLATGLACCLGIGLFIYDELSFDTFHPNLDNLYRVVEKQNQAGVIYNVASTPGPLAVAMKTDFPEVIESCRFGRTSGTLQHEQLTIEPPAIRYTDNSFFSMFNFKLVKGNPSGILKGPDEIVLTPSTASQLLGTNWQTRPDLLGTLITFSSWGGTHTLKLTGIAEEPPANSHIQYSALLSMSMLEKEEYFAWDNNNYQTYVQLNSATDAAGFDLRLRKYIDKYSAYGSKDEARTLFLQPMKDIYLYSNFDFGTDDSKTGNIVYIRIFLATGLVILLIAIFNFVNLSTARAAHRAREVGVRKVIGALYRQLVTQFLVESFLLTLLAIAIAFILLLPLLPLLNDISGKSLYVPLENFEFIGTVIGFALIISLLAGFYPAFYLSSFAPAKVLKGISKVSKRFNFRQVLVVVQFTCSIILVIGAIVIYKQLRFVQDKELGFDRSQLVYVQLKNNLSGKTALIKNELKNQSSIVSAAQTSSSLIDATSSTTSIRWEGQQPDDQFLIAQVNVDADLLHTMGMTLVSGRNFNSGTSDSVTYIINETAAKRMGWTAAQAIGKPVTLWRTDGTVTGVVNDFHFRPLTHVIEPMIFRSWSNSRFSGVFVRTQPGQTQEALASIEMISKLHGDQTDFNYQFVDQALDAQYRMQQNTGRIILLFSILAVLVSCLGLFGLAAYASEQRTKEIGIRKVLGASVTGIVRLLSGDFIKLVLIAIIVATPVAWWGMNWWLQDFAYKIGLNAWIFLITGSMAIAIALLTVGYQSFRAALTNPIKSLRAE